MTAPAIEILVQRSHWTQKKKKKKVLAFLQVQPWWSSAGDRDRAEGPPAQTSLAGTREETENSFTTYTAFTTALKPSNWLTLSQWCGFLIPASGWDSDASVVYSLVM